MIRRFVRTEHLPKHIMPPLFNVMARFTIVSLWWGVFVSVVDAYRPRAALPLRMMSTASSSAAPIREIKLYNSLTRSKEVFTPINEGKVSMYTCGPTVYDHAHVGNFRAFLTYDVLKRTLAYLGYDVDHVCNLTDVDDKIIKRCNEEGVSLVELTRKFEGLFFDDLEALNIVPARAYPRATEHIPEMVQLIKDLENNDLAYRSEEGSWYFNVAQKAGYGQQLVNLDVAGMRSGGGGAAGGDAGRHRGGGTDADEYDADKQGVRDFALWKSFKPGFDREDATWRTDVGRGRPGWHLECSAMAKKFLGDTIDIHCGGIDLKFPHHENEIAQSEGANGKPFCNCWLHNGFVNIGDEKMSKSKGNFLTLRSACPRADDVRAYRYLVVSSHYRNPLSFTEAAIGAARGALKRIDRLNRQLDEALAEHDYSNSGGGGSEQEESGGEIAATVSKNLQNFDLALADDLSMPRAAASMFAVVKAAEGEFKRVAKAEQKRDDGSESDVVPPLDISGLRAVRDGLAQMDRVFGLFYTVPMSPDNGTGEENAVENDAAFPEEVMELVGARAAAKDAKDWDLADSLRNRIAELGFTVKDVKDGDPLVSRIS